MPPDQPRWVSEDRPRLIEAILRELQLLTPSDSLRTVSRAGEGNMNVTLRVTTGDASFIVKQSRPWVAKYPDIAAPAERAHVEQQFYELVAAYPPVARRMPVLLGSSPHDFLLVLQDVGSAGDATDLYRRQAAATGVMRDELHGLVTWLADLHSGSRSLDPGDRPANLALRELNHAHIFQIPLADPPAIDLDAVTPGLAGLAGLVRRDQVRWRLAELGQIYLTGGLQAEASWPCLLHGDFFPGSWLRADDGTVKLIDPEFCYFGGPEFDLGVLVAHLRFARVDEATISRLLRHYVSAAWNFHASLVEAFAAAEVIRRLLGVAQLPLEHSLVEKRKLLVAATRALCEVS